MAETNSPVVPSGRRGMSGMSRPDAITALRRRSRLSRLVAFSRVLLVTMQMLNRFFPAAALIALAGPPCLSQAVPSQSSAPLRELTLDIAGLGLNIGFATRMSDNTGFGVALGVGGNWLNYMALAGGHFAEPGGLSYETKDGAGSKELFDLARVTIFARRHFQNGRQLDIGLKASAFLHHDSSDDDPAGGLFVGFNVTPMWYQRGRLRLGSEIDVGRYSDGAASELGVNVAPLLLRISIP
jgi:hypothetical protein